MIKVCTKCGQEKTSPESFYRDNTKRDGLSPSCKSCRRKYVEANKDVGVSWRQANKSHLAQYHKEYTNTPNGRVASRRADKKYYQTTHGRTVRRKADVEYQKTARGKAIKRKHSAKRRALKLEQMPDNANMVLIQEIYHNCPSGYHVDHIIPLSRGGLHHEDNLCYLPASINLSKGNKTIIEFGLETFNKHVIYWQDII